MGYKVVNKNALINKKKNIVIDTIFFFNNLDNAKEYLELCKTFKSFGKKKLDEEEIPMIEPMTEEEQRKFSFEIPLNYQIPHKTITRPYTIKPNEPYWVQTNELLMP